MIQVENELCPDMVKSSFNVKRLLNRHDPNNGLKARLDMKDNSKCITISLPTSTWSHCFVDIEVNLGSVEVGYER